MMYASPGKLGSWYLLPVISYAIGRVDQPTAAV
jgi:hypothetical protein